MNARVAARRAKTRSSTRSEGGLADRPSPVLADGTALRELIDFDQREVKLRVLGDPEIHRLELKRIFARAWIVVGHVSEIPDPGDFVKRYIGQDQVVVIRGRDGNINILLNACAHRGMEICRADRGNQAGFKCPYHGWVYDIAGNLLGAPFEKQMFGQWDKSQYGLRKAQVAVRHGVIFGSFQPLGDLDDWLGTFAWYFDHMYGRAEMEMLSTPTPTGLNAANWKAAAEQNSGDGYHFITLHQCVVELGFMNPAPKDIAGWSLDCHNVTCAEGHGMRVVEQSHNVFHKTPEPEPFPLGWFVAGSMFPGAACGVTSKRAEATAPQDQEAGAQEKIEWSATIGSLAPKGPQAYNMWFGTLVEKSMPEEIKAGMRRSNAVIAGIVLADDLDVWPSMTRVAQGVIGAEQPIRYNSTLGPSKPEEYPGPGLHGVSVDDSQWHFWLRWYDLMTTESDAAPCKTATTGKRRGRR